MLTLHVGLVVGLILCVIVIFGYGSVVFFQMITNSIEIWTLNYIWFLIFPIATFFFRASERKSRSDSQEL